MQMSSVGNIAPSAPKVQESGPNPEAIHLKASAASAQLEAVEAASDAVPAKQLSEAVENINRSMQALGQDLEFAVDEDSKRTVVKVVDQNTREIIRQMPSVEALEIAKALDRVQGLLIRQKA